jgi:chaperonin GroES
MKLKPIGDRVIVRRDSSEDQSAGGIILPDTAKKKPQRGTILAVGPGKLQDDGKRVAPQVKEGDVVLFTNWAGDEFKERGKIDDVLVMHEEDILAVLN